MRSDNWNEKLGKVKADEVAVVAEDPETGELRPMTLGTYLRSVGAHGTYAGLDGSATPSLYDEALD